MQTITFTCETITPLFLSGADGSTPELRPPSIKGALRFWWRAMHGEEWKKLKEREDEIFGSTNRKSRLLITIVKDWNCTNSEYITNKKYSNKYFLFPLQMLKDRAGIPLGKSFKLGISSSDIEVLKQSLCAFWLLSFLGGIGFRARRGGGNISVKPDDKNTVILSEIGLSFTPNPNQTIDDFINKNLIACKKCIQKHPNQSIANDYSTLINSKVIISETNSSLNDIESLYKKFRSRYTGNQNLLKKAAFGLPLTSTMPPGRPESEHTEIKIMGDDNLNRRASPIIIRMIKFNGALYWLVVKLNGIFLENQIALKYKRSEQVVISARDIDESLLDSFLEALLEENISIKI